MKEILLNIFVKILSAKGGGGRVTKRQKKSFIRTWITHPFLKLKTVMPFNQSLGPFMVR